VLLAQLLCCGHFERQENEQRQVGGAGAIESQHQLSLQFLKLTPIAEPHGCSVPSTWGRTEYAEFRCSCGRHWFLSWLRMPDGAMAGPSWILEGA
jgi:hypothetical protein